MKLLDYTVFFEPVESGGYLVAVPALPGIISFGDSLDEARLMAIDAIRCHLEGLLKDGEPFPEDIKITAEPIREKLSVSVNV